MKRLLIPIFCSTLSFASLSDIYSFKADFIQSVTDDKNATLRYTGHIQAQKPQNALWNYLEPIQKDVFINIFRVTVIEPEIEQVIIRKTQSNFDFFMMVKNATKIKENLYEARYKEAKFFIKTKEEIIESISYKDEFENNVVISFENQKQNIKIDETTFIPEFPEGFDIVRD